MNPRCSRGADAGKGAGARQARPRRPAPHALPPPAQAAAELRSAGRAGCASLFARALAVLVRLEHLGAAVVPPHLIGDLRSKGWGRHGMHGARQEARRRVSVTITRLPRAHPPTQLSPEPSSSCIRTHPPSAHKAPHLVLPVLLMLQRGGAGVEVPGRVGHELQPTTGAGEEEVCQEGAAAVAATQAQQHRRLNCAQQSLTF